MTTVVRQIIETTLQGMEAGVFQDFCLDFLPLSSPRFAGLARFGHTASGKTRAGTPDLLKTDEAGRQTAVQCGTEVDYWGPTKTLEAAKPYTDALKCISSLAGLAEIVLIANREIPTKTPNAKLDLISAVRGKTDAALTLISLEEIGRTLVDALDDDRTRRLLRRYFPEVAVMVEASTETPLGDLVEDEIPAPLQILLDEARQLAEKGNNAAARIACDRALRSASEANHALAEIKARVALASVIRANDLDVARPLYRECLDQLRTTPSVRLHEEVLGQLGDLEAMSGNLLEGKALLTHALEIARRLGDRNRIAANLQSLALVADGQGSSDEAIKLFDDAILLFMAEHQRHDAATEYKAMRGLGACFNNKSVAQKHRADLLGALSSLAQAVEWFRRCESRDDLMRALFLQAEAQFADAKWQEGSAALKESMDIATALDDYIWTSHCLDLFGRLNFTLGREKEASSAFEQALAIMRERGNSEQLVASLGKVARLYAMKGLKVEARTLLLDARDLSQAHGLLEDYADSILELAKLEEGEDTTAKHAQAANTAIEALEGLLVKTQVKGRRAFLMGRIGSLHQRLGRHTEALHWFEQAEDLFEETGDPHGLANCVGAIAEINREQQNPGEEIEAYRRILRMASGTPMHHLVAGTKINLGNCLISYGQFREAQQLFEEAADICEKHHLREFESALFSNLERVRHLLAAHQPVSMDFGQLVRELHELVAFFPETKDGILRFWYYSRDAELHANCRSLLGVKLFVVDDDLDRFIELVGKLSAYSDLNLHAVNSGFPGWGIDLVPYPKDRPIPERVGLPVVSKQDGDTGMVTFVRGGLHWPYSLTSDEATSDESGLTGIIIFGRARGLPQQAHDLMLGHSANDLIAKKMLFVPYERPVPQERLVDDLRLAKEQGLIPVYPGHLPRSDDVDVLAYVSAPVPVLSRAVAEQCRPQVSSLKRKLVRILSLSPEEARGALADIETGLDEIRSICGSVETLPIQLYLLQFPFRGAVQSHITLVLRPAPNRDTSSDETVSSDRFRAP